MSLYERNGVWYYDFRVSGKRYRGTTKQTNAKKAQRVESLLLAKIQEEGELRGNKRVPVLSEFSERFFQWVDASNLEPGSRQYYRTGWSLLKSSPLRGIRLDRITSDSTNFALGKSPSNRNNALRTLRRMLGKAQEWGVVASVPRIKLAKEIGRSHLIEPWMESKILAVALQPLRDVFMIMLDTGMRPAEVFRMKWDDVRWDRNAIFIPHGKSHKSRRYVPLTDRVKAALIARGKMDSGWVFPCHKLKSGKPRTSHGHIVTVQKQWSAVKTSAGIPKSVVFYCGRHTFGTDALALTGNLAAVMSAMGHSHAQTAMIYQHPSLDQLTAALNTRNTIRVGSGHNLGHTGEVVQ